MQKIATHATDDQYENKQAFCSTFVDNNSTNDGNTESKSLNPDLNTLETANLSSLSNLNTKLSISLNKKSTIHEDSLYLGERCLDFCELDDIGDVMSILDSKSVENRNQSDQE